MTNYIRYGTIVADPGNFDMSQLRCRFSIKAQSISTPGTAHILVTNPLASKAREFVKLEFTTITITAGYEDNAGIIFKGQIRQGVFGRENPTDTLLTIIASSMGEQGHNFATVNTTLKAGSTPQDHFNVAMAALGKYGITQGYIGVDLSQPKYPRAVSLFGMARDVLLNIAKLKQATFSYQQGAVQMVPKTGNIPGGPFVLNSNTGMVGMPTQMIGEIQVRAFINPSVRIDTLVKINESSITQAELPLGPDGSLAPPNVNLAAIASDGIYRVFAVDYNGDTRGNPWYMDLHCIIPGQQTDTSKQYPTSS